MDILFVGSGASSEVSAEMAKVASGNKVTILEGNVDRAKLDLALSSGQYGVVHFAGEGNRGILELQDGELEEEDLVSMLSQQKLLRFVVINACNSLSIAAAIHNALHIPVIAHDAPIGEAAATRFAETFYRAYKQTQGDIHESVKRAKATLEKTFPADARAPHLINGDMTTNTAFNKYIASVSAALEAMERKLAEMFGTLDTRVSGIETRIQDLESDMDLLMTKLNDLGMPRKQSFAEKWSVPLLLLVMATIEGITLWLMATAR